MKGKKIYVVDEARIKKHKRDSLLFMIPAEMLFIGERYQQMLQVDLGGDIVGKGI